VESDLSVLIPALDLNEQLVRCIQSILHDPNIDSSQIIVVWDHGNYSNSVHEFILKSGVTFLENSRISGVAGSLNSGLKIAQTSVIRRMDADDNWIESNFKRDIKPIVSSFGIATGNALTSNGQINSGARRPRVPNLAGGVIDNLAFAIGNPICHPATYFLTDLVVKIGGYDETKSAEDYDLWLRLLDSGVEIFHIEKDVVIYNRHSNQTSNFLKAKNVSSEIYQLLKNILPGFPLTEALLALALCRSSNCSHKTEDFNDYRMLVEMILESRSFRMLALNSQMNIISRILIPYITHRKFSALSNVIPKIAREYPNQSLGILKYMAKVKKQSAKSF